ncbi:MAG: hypothetical protein QOG91_43 [Candidatus Parcubacteria bacterium]|jgi:membrane-bound lytic murein transglycosylase B|nr:hypothetical protein [Candidatus Parcubacteria bacterium]
MKSVWLLAAIVGLAVLGAAPRDLYAQALTAEQRAALEQELAQVEAEQKQAAKDLSAAQAESSSLARDIAVLNAKIKAAQLDIKAKNLQIQTLGNDINQKENHIEELDARIEKGKATLAVVLRKTNEIDSYSLPEVMLSQTTVAGFFKDIDTFQSVESGLKSTFEQLRADQAATAAEKDSLDNRRNAELDARHEIEVQEQSIKSNQASKQQLLTVSKGNEKSYSSLLAQKQARAAQIRAALFSLRDAAAIPFGQALQYAQAASQKTGVRPALILAIMTQESALGKNVGSCYVTDNGTGSGVYAKTGSPVEDVMNPTRDIPPFLQILNELGGDSSKTLVSCPQSIGWGGAMGPAQFIASTWVILKDRLAGALGISSMPDPWNPSHAFMATAMYLSDRGAVAGSYTSEKNAACKYYSGGACSKSSTVNNYGSSVMALADNIQRNMIDPLAGL